MNPVDFHIARFFSSFASQHWRLDSLPYAAAQSYFWKGEILMALFWAAWFRKRASEAIVQEALVATLLACVLGLGIGRALVSTLPYRARPIDSPVFQYNVPYPVDHSNAHDWSSFPSDHAILFVALAAGIYCAWRFAGAIAIVYVAVVVCFPRLYLGYHYLTDILAGALIGGGIVWLFNRQQIRTQITRLPLRFHHRNPGLFYAVLFLLSYQIADLFNPVRHVLSALRNVVSVLLNYSGVA
jgi:undecaprenyl-diphosphatase